MLICTIMRTQVSIVGRVVKGVQSIRSLREVSIAPLRRGREWVCRVMRLWSLIEVSMAPLRRSWGRE